MFAKLASVKSRYFWLIVFSMSLPPAGHAAEALDLSHIPARAVAAVVAQPERLSQSPELELLPWEVIQAAAQQELGIDPLAIETAIAIAAAPTGEGPPDWGLILRFSQPQQLADTWLEQTEEATVGEVSYRRAVAPMAPSFCQLDPRTLLVGAEPMLREMIATGEVASPLRQMLSSLPMRNDITAVLAVSPIRDQIKQLAAGAPPLPPPLQPLLNVPDQLEAVMVAVNLSRERVSGLQLIATDEAAAQKLQTTLQQSLGFAKQMLLAQMLQAAGDGEDATEEAMQRYLMRVADTIEGRLRPTRTGNRLLITLDADYASTGVLVALLLPAVQAAREAARRTQSLNNLKQLALAMHNYHDTYRHFPAAYSTDAAGEPLLSWRVYLLPFLEEQTLFEQFRLDEPWDSPHNRQLIAQMPDVFRAPGSQLLQGKTNYLGIRGEEMAFIAPKQAGPRPEGSRMADFTGGTSNTLMIVEASDAVAVEWTRPADYEPNEAQPAAGLVGLRPGGFQAAFADGSVRMISSEIDPAMLMRLYRKTEAVEGLTPFP
jgi:hypothetical protein